MTIAVFYVTLCTASYYLASRAKITEPLWSRYPDWLEYWASCSACFGFWAGLACGVIGARCGLPLFGLDPDHWLTLAAAGSLGMVWTPIVAFAHTYAWSGLTLGNGEGDEGDEGDEGYW